MKRMLRQVWQGWPFWPLAIGVMASAFVCGLLFARNLSAKRDTTIPEGAVVYSIGSVTGPVALYRDYREVPYATTPYPPLYYLAAAAAAAVMGGASPDVATTYLAGRLVAVAATLLAMQAVFMIVRLRDGSRPAAALAVSTLFTVSFLHPWSTTCRPDTLALAFSLWGIAAALRRGRTGDWLAIVAFVCGILTKHSFVAAPLAMTLWMIAEHELRRAYAFVARLTICLLLAVMVCQWSSGGWFWFNIHGANVAPLVAYQPLLFLYYFFRWGWFPPALAVVSLLVARPPLRQPPLETIYLAVALVTAVFSSLKAGADLNYFLELSFACAIVAGANWQVLSQWIGQSFNRRWCACAVLQLCCCVPLVHTAGKTFLHISDEDDPRHLAAVAAVGQLSGQVLIGDAGLAVRSGKAPIVARHLQRQLPLAMREK